mgnify:CR=1 FL=1
MAGNVRFEDNSMHVMAELDEIAFLYEAAETLANQVAENTPVGSGQLAGAWDYKVDEGSGVATVGNPLENAIGSNRLDVIEADICTSCFRKK